MKNTFLLLFVLLASKVIGQNGILVPLHNNIQDHF